MSNKIYGIPAATPLNPEKVYDDAVIAGAVEKYLEENPPVCDIPTVLPNPHALTINGVSYDGSEAVDVTIKADDGGIVTETDPTVPAWAKASTKPSYTASEVGAVPDTRTVNGKALSSDVSLSASDVGARPSTWMPTATDVGARPDTWLPTPSEIGAPTKGELDKKVDSVGGEVFGLTANGILNLKQPDKKEGVYLSGNLDTERNLGYLEILGTAADEPVRVSGLATPQASNDAANKGYVDDNFVSRENGEARWLTTKGELKLMPEGEDEGVYLFGRLYESGAINKAVVEMMGTIADEFVILRGLDNPEQGNDAVPLSYAEKNFASVGLIRNDIAFYADTEGSIVMWLDDYLLSDAPSPSITYAPLSYSNNIDGSHTAGNGVIRLFKNTATEAYAIFESADGTKKWRKSYVGGVWKPLEWFDAPMVIGVEYRTTERWNGKVKYKKLIEYTNPEAISGSMTLNVPHGITNLHMMLTAQCTTSGYLLPYLTAGSSLGLSAWDSSNLVLYGNSSWGAGRKWYIEMCYTKTTD